MRGHPADAPVELAGHGFNARLHARRCDDAGREIRSAWAERHDVGQYRDAETAVLANAHAVRILRSSMSSISSGNRHWNWLAQCCVVCAIEPGAPVCAGCEADFFPPPAPRCARCAARLETAAAMCGHCIARAPSFDPTLTPADYVTPVSGMVGALKFSARLDLADVFGRLLATREPLRAKLTWCSRCRCRIERESERGFNQSREIVRRSAMGSCCGSRPHGATAVAGPGGTSAQRPRRVRCHRRCAGSARGRGRRRDDHGQHRWARSLPC